MPLVPASSPAVIEAQLRRLRERAAHHKSEVGRHRKALHQTMAAIAALEGRRGADRVTGEGETPWPPPNPSSH